MTYYYSDENAPWYDLRDKIDCVIVDEGVTSIGDEAFAVCSSLTIYYSGNALDEYINQNQDKWNKKYITWIKQ